MIEFNENDYNLPQIKSDSKLFNLMTMYPYRAYGLKKEANPLILLEFNSNIVDQSFMDRLKDLDAFFTANGLDFLAEDTEEGEKMFIGLRKDLRKHVVLSSTILQTMVYCLEDRLNVKKDFKIAGIPKFDVEKAHQLEKLAEKVETPKPVETPVAATTPAQTTTDLPEFTLTPVIDNSMPSTN